MLDLLAKIEAAELPGGQLVVSARGPLDERVALELRNTLLPVAAAECSVVVLDLQDAHGLDDTTLRVIGRAAELVADRGHRLAVLTRSPVLVQLIDGHNLSALVRLHSTLRGAIGGD